MKYFVFLLSFLIFTSCKSQEDHLRTKPIGGTPDAYGLYGTTEYTECQSGDCVNGKGKNKHVRMYQMQLQNHRRFAKHVEIYEGEFKNGKRNGIGILKMTLELQDVSANPEYKHSSYPITHAGRFINDRLAEGYLDSKMRKYTGSFYVDDTNRRYKTGSLYFKDTKCTITGSWKTTGTGINQYDYIDGPIEEKCEDGYHAISSATLKDGRQGPTTEIFPDGRKFEGLFKKGKRVSGKLFDKNGQLVYEGKFQGIYPMIKFEISEALQKLKAKEKIINKWTSAKTIIHGFNNIERFKSKLPALDKIENFTTHTIVYTNYKEYTIYLDYVTDNFDFKKFKKGDSIQWEGRIQAIHNNEIMIVVYPPIKAD